MFIGSAVFFAVLTYVTNTETDTQTHHAASRHV